MEADERARHQAELRAIKATLRAIGDETRRLLADDRSACKAERKTAREEARRLFRRKVERARAVREKTIERARVSCSLRKARTKAEAEAKREAKLARRAEIREHRRRLRSAKRHDRERRREARGLFGPMRGTRARVRRAEVRGRNRDEIERTDPTLLPAWDRFGQRFHYQPDGWEKFQEWAEENPEHVLRARELAAARSDRAHAREARTFHREQQAAALAEVPF